MKLHRDVLALGEVAHPERTRYAMNAVRFQSLDGVASAEATNGKMVARVTWDEDNDDPPHDTLASREAVLAMAKVTKPHKAADLAHPERETVTLTTGPVPGLVAMDKAGAFVGAGAGPVEGHYPPTADFMDKDYGPYASVALDVDLLHTLVAALAQAAGADGLTACLDLPKRHGGPVRVRVAGRCREGAKLTSAVGLLMPLTTPPDDPRFLPTAPPGESK